MFDPAPTYSTEAMAKIVHHTSAIRQSLKKIDEQSLDAIIETVKQGLEALGDDPSSDCFVHHTIDSHNYIANRIDHTLLKLDATEAQIDQLCEEAKEQGFHAVCVRLSWVERAVSKLKDSRSNVACVIGFHEGTYSTQAKIEEAKKAVETGAKELDMVMNYHQLKHGRRFEVFEEVRLVRQQAPEDRMQIKVIIETSQLSRDQIIEASVVALAAGADTIKTSTGFCGQGATVENVRLMSHVALLMGGDNLVKASGGIKTYDHCYAMIAAGASRIGTSNGVAIMKEVDILEAQNYE